ncbi:hypothetical protein D3C77_492670 [compost metagenome]
MLLHLIQRLLQEQHGEPLPAQAVMVVPGLVSGQRQGIAEQHAVGRTVQPLLQGRGGIQGPPLVPGSRAGDAQRLDQRVALLVERLVALHYPGGQAPMPDQRQAQGDQRHAEQLEFHLARRPPLAEYPCRPAQDEIRMGHGQGPERREEQQAVPLHLLAEVRQRRDEQAAGLLAGVLADQVQLAQGQGRVLGAQYRQLAQQCFGTLQAQAGQGGFEAVRRLDQAAGRAAVGLAQQRQGQCRAGQHGLGYLAQRDAGPVQRQQQVAADVAGDRQGDAVQMLDPGVERLWRQG